MKKVSLLLVAVMAASLSFAQSEIGVVGGSFNGVSYKQYVSSNFAIQADLGWGIQQTYGMLQVNDYKSDALSKKMWDVSLNPNAMYVMNLGSGVEAFAGLGVSIGMMQFIKPEQIGFYDTDKLFGKAGANAIVGAEYKFSGAPIALSLDFRPGYALAFGEQKNLIVGQPMNVLFHYFDWHLALGVRYCF